MVSGRRVYSHLYEDAQKAYQAALRIRACADDGVTLTDAMAHALEEARTKRTAGTVRWYEDHFAALRIQFGEDTPLHRITPQRIEEVVRERLREVAAATVNADLRALHRVFAIAIRRGHVDKNAVKMVDRPREDRPPIDWFTEAELAILLEQVTVEMDRDLFAVVAYSGVRRSELARLGPDHVRLQLRQIVVPGKTGTRIVPIADDIVTPLERMLAVCTDRLVVGGVKTIDATFRRWKSALGDPRWHPHALRHTFGTSLIRAGVRVDVVMRLMGHRSINTTLRYVHEVGVDGIDAVARLRLLPREPGRQQAR